MKTNLSTPLISIISVNYNNTKVTCELLNSLNKVSYKNIEVIIVDNASVDNPSEEILEACPEAKVILSPTNLGFAGGNNLGIKAASGDFLFFLNNDTELEPDAIEPLLEIFEIYKDAGVSCPKFHFYFHPNIIEYAGYHKVNPFTARNKPVGSKKVDNGQYNKISSTHYAHGAAMLIPRTVIEKVGMMPEEFFLYYEEFDWCEQIKRAGYKIYYQPASLVYHKESMSVGKKSTLKTYYLIRNRIYFMRRNVKDFRFYFFLFYLIMITIPKNLLTYFIKLEFNHIKAFTRGVLWNLKLRTP